MAQPKTEFEIIRVSERKVACDGGGGPLGHPKVYLHILAENNNSVVCPYCSRTYKLKAS